MNPEDKYPVEQPSSVYVARQIAPVIRQISEGERMQNLLNQADKNKTYIGDRDKARHYANMQGMVNHNLLGYGASPAHIDYDPTTPYGQAMIWNSVKYMQNNPTSAIMASIAPVTRAMLTTKKPFPYYRSIVKPTSVEFVFKKEPLSNYFTEPATFNYWMTLPEAAVPALSTDHLILSAKDFHDENKPRGFLNLKFNFDE